MWVHDLGPKISLTFIWGIKKYILSNPSELKNEPDAVSYCLTKTELARKLMRFKLLQGENRYLTIAFELLDWAVIKVWPLVNLFSTFFFFIFLLETVWGGFSVNDNPKSPHKLRSKVRIQTHFFVLFPCILVGIDHGK